jgi:hypothetical protein
MAWNMQIIFMGLTGGCQHISLNGVLADIPHPKRKISKQKIIA